MKECCICGERVDHAYYVKGNYYCNDICLFNFISIEEYLDHFEPSEELFKNLMDILL